jgi:hypothetical protein
MKELDMSVADVLNWFSYNKEWHDHLQQEEEITKIIQEERIIREMI